MFLKIKSKMQINYTNFQSKNEIIKTIAQRRKKNQLSQFSHFNLSSSRQMKHFSLISAMTIGRENTEA